MLMNKLRPTLIIAFFTIATLPLVFLAYISDKMYGETIHREVSNSLSAIADHKVSQWLNFETQIRQRITLVSRSSTLRSHIKEFRDHLETGDVESTGFKSIEAELKVLVRDIKSVAGFRNFFIISPSGDILYQDGKQLSETSNLSSNRYRGSGLRQVFDKALSQNKASISEFTPDIEYPELYSFYMGVPVSEQGKTIAVLVEQFDNRELINIANDYTGIGETGEVVFAKLDRNSALLMSPLRHVQGATYNKTIDLVGEAGRPIHEALAGREAVGASTDYRAQPVLAAWRHLETVNLGMVVKIDEDEAFAQLVAHSHNMFFVLALSLLFVTLVGVWMAARILSPVSKMGLAAKAITDGDLDHKVPTSTWYEFDHLGVALNQMVEKLRNTIDSVEADLWYKDGITKISEVVGADQSSQVLARNTIRTLTEHLNAQAGAMYICAGSKLELLGHYGLGDTPDLDEVVSSDHGLLGQVMADKTHMIVRSNGDTPIELQIRSGIQKTPANCLLIAPLIYHGQVVALVELAWLGTIPDRTLQLLDFASESISLAIIAAEQRQQVQQMLEESQAQTEELQVQQEELRVANEELRKKGIELRVQSEVLKTAKEETERQAQELELASRYKSEFLANMSHELRTPLNSLLILARSLVDNDDGNLAEEEVESATVIHDSGKHLLNLINDILDISKVESGKMQVNVEPIMIEELLASVRSRFGHMASEKGTDLCLVADKDIPAQIYTDGAKLNQILTNLIGNAIKFTDKGQVKLNLFVASNSDGRPSLNFSVEDTGIGIPSEKIQSIFQAFQQVDGSISRSYGGTGLGLSIARKLSEVLGGDIGVNSVLGEGSCFRLELPLSALAPDTGVSVSPSLGSTVESREAASVVASSTGGGGSVLSSMAMPERQGVASVADDREALDPNKPLLLIVEDDPKFSSILLNTCHQQNCQAIIAGDGETGVAMAEQYPVQGVILDYMLPGLDGSDVLAALKSNAATQNLPVHIITALDGLSDMQILGAVGKSLKPTSAKELKEVIAQLTSSDQQGIKMLVVEDDHATFLALGRLLKMEGIALSQACSGEDAVDMLSSEHFDGIIMDLGLPDTNGFDLLDRLDRDEQLPMPPVIVYTGKDLSLDEQNKLGRFTQQIVIKSENSAERMLEEVHTFASLVCRSNEIRQDHSTVSDSPAQEAALRAQNQIQNQAQAESPSPVKNPDEPRETISVSEQRSGDFDLAPEPPVSKRDIRPELTEKVDLDERVVLLVDDDMRNTFALAKVLRKKGLTVHLAPGGEEAIGLVRDRDDIELVLMDIMMPEMDGYEATRQIRAIEGMAELPIIAVTANAMVGDKEKCIEAGANDYLSKPVDIDQLMELLQLWLQPAQEKI